MEAGKIPMSETMGIERLGRFPGGGPVLIRAVAKV